ncbi:hypothetical protein CSUB01_11463 [Colletotrichum sublineola]|uniref:Uncharacterized protein n=1 Tax=Colletotrichum sublineola TaxID=1173701 RepID=A0A066XAE8_COLSU|nr:hypothetical protein CSUB01_11463 [Colletotrichum sublineola]
MQHMDEREELQGQMMETSAEKAEAINAETNPRRTFKVGDMIWEKVNKDGKAKSKFEASWTGPWEVREVCSDVSYRITERGSKRGEQGRKVHVSDLKAHWDRPSRLKLSTPLTPETTMTMNNLFHTLTLDLNLDMTDAELDAAVEREEQKLMRGPRG